MTYEKIDCREQNGHFEEITSFNIVETSLIIMTMIDEVTYEMEENTNPSLLCLYRHLLLIFAFSPLPV
jgi:hypothetical protein